MGRLGGCCALRDGEGWSGEWCCWAYYSWLSMYGHRIDSAGQTHGEVMFGVRLHDISPKL